MQPLTLKPARGPFPGAQRQTSIPVRAGRTTVVGLDMSAGAGTHLGAAPASLVPALSAAMSRVSLLSRRTGAGHGDPRGSGARQEPEQLPGGLVNPQPESSLSWGASRRMAREEM